MLGFTNVANCNNTQIAENNPVTPKGKIIIAKFDNDINWETAYNSKKLVSTEVSSDVISYLKEEIKTKKRPIVTGVHYTNRSTKPPGNSNKSTYHFLLIVGYGSDEKGEYFRFYDPGRSAIYQEHAISKDNRLYVKDNFISGNYQDKTYTITQIDKFY